MCYSSHDILEIIHFWYQIRSLKPFIGQHKWIEHNITFQHGNQIRMFPKVTVIEQLMYTFNFPSLFSPYFIHTCADPYFFSEVVRRQDFFWGGGLKANFL